MNRKKKGELAAYWLSYNDGTSLYQLEQAGIGIIGQRDENMEIIGGSDDKKDLILFVREMNLLTVALNTPLSIERVKREFFNWKPINLKMLTDSNEYDKGTTH